MRNFVNIFRRSDPCWRSIEQEVHPCANYANNLKAGGPMATLDWSQCPGVESVPGKLSGAWVFRESRMPVKLVFENLEDGMTIDEIIEQYDVTREQVKAVIDFAARSLDAVSS